MIGCRKVDSRDRCGAERNRAGAREQPRERVQRTPSRPTIARNIRGRAATITLISTASSASYGAVLKPYEMGAQRMTRQRRDDRRMGVENSTIAAPLRLRQNPCFQVFSGTG
jgi:hypothetical protein